MIISLQDQRSGAAFSKQAPVFDELDRSNGILLWMRDQVQQEVMGFAAPGQQMLELNCGTGIDAIAFAAKGIHVLATDNAPGMLEAAQSKVHAAGLEHMVRVRKCSFNQLGDLRDEPRFDYVFSNFGGLNCAADLPAVLDEVHELLRPGGRFTIVIMPRICPWELLLAARGKFRTAFRRLRRGGVEAKVEGLPFRCYYYNAGPLMGHLDDRFRLLRLSSLGLLVPPPYIEGFADRYPRAFGLLSRMELRIRTWWPFRYWGDHIMLTMEKLP